MTTTEVVTLGECLISLIAARPGSLAEAAVFERQIAGAEANVAVGLARLGHRRSTSGGSAATASEQPSSGAFAARASTSASSRSIPEATTGLMVRERRVLGAAEVVYARTGSAGSRVSPDDVRRAAADGVFGEGRWLHLTGITPALSDTAMAAVECAVDVAKESKMTVSFDVNLRRRLWSDDVAGPVVRPLAEQFGRRPREPRRAGGRHRARPTSIRPPSRRPCWTWVPRSRS